jgi:hypothetical protein
MLRLLQLAYGRKGFRWDKIDTPDDLEALKPNEATIASYGTDKDGHYFVVYRKTNEKTETSVYYVFDPQSKSVLSLTDYLDAEKRETFYICSIDADQESIEWGDARITKEIDTLFE